MSTPLAIALNVLLDLGVIAALAYATSSASRLTPHRSAADATTPHALPARRRAQQGPATSLDLAA
ncbi:MAG TPA: hypothetical protein VKG38_04890 [Solirubrobacteraceae bacterium]|nr:hypothetical protein [Solirubrobacteraceae bacterium]